MSIRKWWRDFWDTDKEIRVYAKRQRLLANMMLAEVEKVHSGAAVTADAVARIKVFEEKLDAMTNDQLLEYQPAPEEGGQ